jgi:hypothetical protein
LQRSFAKNAQDFASGLPLLHPATRKPCVSGTPASLKPANRLKLAFYR